jgi:predicted porin
MRNTKIALAVLALVASTAAMADGANVYGHIDASVSKQTNQNTQFGEGNWDSSVFGVKGSEDLESGGMKASYNLEVGYNSGNGAMANGGTVFGVAPNPVFNRQANVALSGEFGSVKLGLQISPMILAQLAGAATGNQSFNVNMLAMAGSVASTLNANSSAGGTLGFSTGGFFIPNAVSYTTPSIGGFSATALTQLAAAGSTTTTGQEYSTFTTSFASGDVNVSAGYETKKTALAATTFGGLNVTAGTTETKTYSIASGYQLGAARIGGGYISVDNVASANKLNTYYLSLGYDVASNINLSLNYARNNATVANSITSLGAKYGLSKRTYAYATAARADGASALYSSAAVTSAGSTTVNGFAVGVGHSF